MFKFCEANELHYKIRDSLHEDLIYQQVSSIEVTLDQYCPHIISIGFHNFNLDVYTIQLART